MMSMVTSAAPATEKQLTLVFAGNIPDIGVHTYGTYSGLAGLLEKIKPTLPYMQPKKQAKTPIS